MLAISIKGLSISYDRKIVLSNIYLDLEAGKIYGVIGPNGAGKSTLFKAILGLIKPDAGKIFIHGADISEERRHMVYVPQRDEVDWQFPATVEDVVLMGRYPHKKIFERLNDLDRKIALQSMQETDIQHLAKKQIGELSGGQQQRVFIARALCQNADIMLLDEPFAGVDMTTEEKIISILKKQAKQGKTLLVVHHDLSTVADYFDSVILINQRLIAAGDTFSTFNQENIAKTFGGQLPVLHRI